MKTRTFHVSNLGSFGASVPTDRDGYVTYHDSKRYEKASNAKLVEWTESRCKTVRAAAWTELAERGISAWRAQQ